MKQLVSLTSIVFLCSTFLTAQDISMSKSLEAKEMTTINTVSGNCIIQTAMSDSIHISLEASYNKDCFSYKIVSEEDRIIIKEEFKGNCSGYSNWTILVPSKTEIEYNSASGNLEISGISDEISANTASGNITLTDVADKINIGTASGDVVITNASGEINIGTASGNVEITDVSDKISAGTASGNITIGDATDIISAGTASGNIRITGVSNETIASAASGNVTVQLSQTPEHDISVSSASGTATLNCSGNDIKGTYIFEARKDRGRIVSPYPFDEEVVIDKDGKKYDRKSFTKEYNQPTVEIKTDSGTAKMIK